MSTRRGYFLGKSSVLTFSDLTFFSVNICCSNFQCVRGWTRYAQKWTLFSKIWNLGVPPSPISPSGGGADGLMENLNFCFTKLTLGPCRFFQGASLPRKVCIFEEISTSTFQKYILLMRCDVCEKSYERLKSIGFLLKMGFGKKIPT